MEDREAMDDWHLDVLHPVRRLWHNRGRHCADCRWIHMVRGHESAVSTIVQPKRFKKVCGLENSPGITHGSLTIPQVLKEASESMRTL